MRRCGNRTGAYRFSGGAVFLPQDRQFHAEALPQHRLLTDSDVL